MADDSGDVHPGADPSGLTVSWAGDVDLAEVLVAANRHAWIIAHQDLAAWGQPEPPPAPAPPGAGPPAAAPSAAAPATAAPATAAPHPGAEGLPAEQGLLGAQSLASTGPDEDPLAEEEWQAVAAGGCPVPVESLAGHARLIPGAGLAGWLSCAAADGLDEAGLANSITGWRKLTSWAQAQELTAVAELARRRGVTTDPQPDRDPATELAAEFAPNEVALALTMTLNSAEYWTDLAVSLAERLPATLAALRAGSIDLARARLIEQYTALLPKNLARKVESAVLAKAEWQTTGQLRAALRRAVISADPAAAERRRQEAEKNARVELTGDDEGTASLAGRWLPAGQAAAAWSRLTVMAKALQDSGAAGGMDLLRAQAFIGLLLGTIQPPGPPRPPEPPGSPGPVSPSDGAPGPSAGSASGGGPAPGAGSASGGGPAPGDEPDAHRPQGPPSPGHPPGDQPGSAGPAPGGPGPAVRRRPARRSRSGRSWSRQPRLRRSRSGRSWSRQPRLRRSRSGRSWSRQPRPRRRHGGQQARAHCAVADTRGPVRRARAADPDRPGHRGCGRGARRGRCGRSDLPMAGHRG